MNYQIEGDPVVELEQHQGQNYQIPSAYRTSLKHQRTMKWQKLSTRFKVRNMGQEELYHRLQPYLLSSKELEANGFPLDTPEKPGKVYFKYNSSYHNYKRTCSRCGEQYSIAHNSEYNSENMCTYHPGRRLKGTGIYSCCNELSKGCSTSLNHVSSPPPVGEMEFVKTRHKSFPPFCVQNKVYSLDTELCYTHKGLEVTRVTVLNYEGIVVYDAYIKPENPVIDYNTRYSGVTEDDLKNVTITLADVQALLLELLHSGTILIGHGLENDLKALKLIHRTVVDTSIVFSDQHYPSRKRSLKSLAASYLQKKIQKSEEGHDSVEDARTCLELMQWKIQSEKRLPQTLYTSVPNVQNETVPLLPIPSSPIYANHMFMPNHLGYFIPPAIHY